MPALKLAHSVLLQLVHSVPLHLLPVLSEPQHQLPEVSSVLPPHLQQLLADLVHLHQQPVHLGLRQPQLLVLPLHPQQVHLVLQPQRSVRLLHRLEVCLVHRHLLQQEGVSLGHHHLHRREDYLARPLLLHLLPVLADLEPLHLPLLQHLVLLLHRREVYLEHRRPLQRQVVYLGHRHPHQLLVLLLLLRPLLVSFICNSSQS